MTYEEFETEFAAKLASMSDDELLQALKAAGFEEVPAEDATTNNQNT